VGLATIVVARESNDSTGRNKVGSGKTRFRTDSGESNPGAASRFADVIRPDIPAGTQSCSLWRQGVVKRDVSNVAPPAFANSAARESADSSGRNKVGPGKTIFRTDSGESNPGAASRFAKVIRPGIPAGTQSCPSVATRGGETHSKAALPLSYAPPNKIIRATGFEPVTCSVIGM
jgi:hypothetical protein